MDGMPSAQDGVLEVVIVLKKMDVHTLAMDIDISQRSTMASVDLVIVEPGRYLG